MNSTIISLPNQKKVAYSSHGKGTTIILLHGFCEDKSLWDDLVPSLALDFQVVTIDLPGFGASDLAEETTLDYYADSVISVMDTIKVEKAIILGHSMGGYTALNILDRFGNRCLGIGLINSNPYADSDFKKTIRQKSIDFITNNGSALYVKQMMSSLFETSFAKSNRTTVEKMTYNAAQCNPQGIIDAQKAMMSRADRTELIQSCTVPVLFIIGLKDQLILEKDNLKQLTLPTITKVSIQPKAAHMSIFEAPKETQKSIKEFGRYIETINN